MRRDLETTSPESAAEFERTHTPPIRDEQPNPADCVGATVDPDPAFAAWLIATRQRLDWERYEQTRSRR